MILLSAQRHRVPEIAKLFDTTPTTVRGWLRRFEEAGPQGLYDEPRSGRPRKVTPPVEEKLVHLITDDPQRADPTFLATFWTVAMLVTAVLATLKVTLSASTVRPTLHRQIGRAHR